MEGHWVLNMHSIYCASTVPNVFCFTEHSSNGAQYQENARSCSQKTEFGMSQGNAENKLILDS